MHGKGVMYYDAEGKAYYDGTWDQDNKVVKLTLTLTLTLNPKP